MTFDIRRIDLDKLNSLTKYPSLVTYHTLGDKGALREAVQMPFAGRVLGTEKVDGTNTRLIFCPDGSAVVGSREDLLWERRDLIGNPSMGIVDAVRLGQGERPWYPLATMLIELPASGTDAPRRR